MKRLFALMLMLAMLSGCGSMASMTETILPEQSEQIGETVDVTQSQPPLTEPELESLDERAAKLGERFGVQIRIGDACDSTFHNFTAELLLDETKIAGGLEVLERTMSRYPEGFFRQLRWGEIEQLEIQLVAALHADERYGCGDYSAFVDQTEDSCILIVNVDQTQEYTYFHEFSHVIDRKLAWDAACRKDSKYSEETWASFNPEGFSYLEDYAAIPPELPNRAYYESFLSPYAMVNATEDRAMVMEASMSVPWAFDEAPGLRQKLAYYCDCIRDCFDTTGWPEVTPWEAVLEP